MSKVPMTWQPRSAAALLLMPLLLLTSCSLLASPSCPKQPVPEPKPVVSVVPERPPCNLPPLPVPMHFVGFPDADGSRIYVTKDDLADLARYLVGLQLWIRAATDCLQVPS